MESIMSIMTVVLAVAANVTPRLVGIGTGWAYMGDAEPIRLELVLHYDIPAAEIGSPRGAQRLVITSDEPLPVVPEWREAVTMGGAVNGGYTFLNIDGWGFIVVYPLDADIRKRNTDGRAKKHRGPQGVITVEQNEDTLFRVMPLNANRYELEIYGRPELESVKK